MDIFSCREDLDLFVSGLCRCSWTRYLLPLVNSFSLLALSRLVNTYVLACVVQGWLHPAVLCVWSMLDENMLVYMFTQGHKNKRFKKGRHSQNGCKGELFRRQVIYEGVVHNWELREPREMPDANPAGWRSETIVRKSIPANNTFQKFVRASCSIHVLVGSPLRRRGSL